jgi:excinuclease UvrABC helicase subunit UvrB
VTGSDNTLTMTNIINKNQRPALIMVHNKKYGIIPITIKKRLSNSLSLAIDNISDKVCNGNKLYLSAVQNNIYKIEKQIRASSKDLGFEKDVELMDILNKLKKTY